MNQNTEYEKLVALIESSLKEFDNVTVSHDETLIDNDGNPCQIDVLIEIELGERLGKSRIAVECKNKSNRKIERQTMGAFIEMINSLNIAKGIYVSRKGFQRGARIKAEKSNKILLYTLDTINRGEISNWIEDSPLTKYGIIPLWTTLNLSIDSENEEINSIDPNLLLSMETIFNYNGEQFFINQFLINEHDYFLQTRGTQVIFDGYARFGKNIKNKKFEVNQTRQYNNNFMITIDDKEINITKTVIKYMSKVTTETSIEHYTQAYKAIGNNNTEAEVFTAKFTDSVVNFVKGKDDRMPIGYVQRKESEDYEKIFNLGRLKEIRKEEE